MTVGKGIGGGWPSRRSSARRRHGHWAPGTHTSTFMGDAVNLAAGVAAIGVLRERASSAAPARSARRARHAERRARADDGVGEIRGSGLFIGIEIVPTGTGAPDPDRAASIRRAAFARGVVLGAGGHHENVIKLCPPLTIDEDLLDTALGITIETIEGADDRRPHRRHPVDNYIAGRWAPAASGATLESRDPATGELVAVAPRSGARTSARHRGGARDVRRRLRGRPPRPRTRGDPARARAPPARGGRAAVAPRRDRDGQADPLRPRARARARRSTAILFYASAARMIRAR
jgi:hypothetical protein